MALPSSLTPSRFAQTLRETLEPLAHAIANGDTHISKRDAARALKSNPQAEIARDALETISRTGAVTVKHFIEAEVAKAEAAATLASQGDGRLSKADAESLPADLRLAYHFLKTGELRARAGLASQIPAPWRDALGGQRATLANLDTFLKSERATQTVYPPSGQVFAALEHTPLDRVKVVLLGQDPYHGPGQAHGLSFSVPDGVKVPPSLRNIFKELASDLGRETPTSGNLESWADNGVLLLNAVLTVRGGEPASHAKRGWEDVTRAVLDAVNAKNEPVVFLLLGAHAQRIADTIDTSKHTIVARSHPSPFSARNNFLGTKPFTEINAALTESGRGEIDWV